MYWVSMTDTFMSGWGSAEGVIEKYVIECDTQEQAEQIARRAENRSEMKTVNIRLKKPHYPTATHHVSYRHYDELGGAWKEPVR